MAGVSEYSKKLGRFFKPTASIISLMLISSLPITHTKRFTFSDEGRMSAELVCDSLIADFNGFSGFLIIFENRIKITYI